MHDRHEPTKKAPVVAQEHLCEPNSHIVLLGLDQRGLNGWILTVLRYDLQDKVTGFRTKEIGKLVKDAHGLPPRTPNGRTSK
jgi:hypothetical protein